MDNDLISRKALIALFEELRDKPTTHLREKEYLNAVMAVIDTVPAAEQKAKRESNWIRVSDRPPDVPVFLGITRDNPEPLIYWQDMKCKPGWTVSGINIKRDMLWWKPRPYAQKEHLR
ncbi:MAG: hypothetical protein IJ994_00145 [Firmicutes bacterium]|nr:hypothetical protein [Bacillota bacterium]